MSTLVIGGLASTKAHVEPLSGGVTTCFVTPEMRKHEGFTHRLAYATDMLRQLEGNVDVLAHSAGCPVALTLAHRFPDKVQSLTLVAPAPMHGLWVLFYAPLARVMWKYLLPMLTGRLFCASRNDLTWLGLNGCDKHAAKCVLDTAADISGAEARVYTLPMLQPRLGEYRTPTAIVIPERDQWVNPKTQKQLAGIVKKHNKGRTGIFYVSDAPHYAQFHRSWKRVHNAVQLWHKEPTNCIMSL